ncbi:hypothetical protein [Halanaerobacter jeridensis]|uniref:Uncharacterized protein n=1 Tax=Halanaerobacter jeridensis TaxID=706427 RepID=A0A938XRN1_9FIRM|nr:hypothetical protein [Halanaerobacter jeridensis]MBM7556158.1 hypothetical protein [Halanaerobacter jeridensis]
MNFEQTILAYSYLSKKIKFKRQFDVFDRPLQFQKNKSKKNVKSFGIKRSLDQEEDNLKRQVDILDYKNNDNFILKLKTNAGVDEIILAKIEPKENLLQTIDYVRQRIKQNKNNTPNLQKNEVLQIPTMKFNLEHSYFDLIGDVVLNDGRVVTKAIQNVDFRLNETGATVRFKAKIKISKGIFRNKRSFIFDKPFLMYVKEQGAKYPYLAAWIANTEFLVKKH